MQATNDYLRLRKALGGGHPDGRPFHVTMGEIAQSLYCTERNARLILHKMIDSGLIRFIPGRGRGNASELTFLRSVGDAVKEEAEGLAKRGQMEAAFEVLKEYGNAAYNKEHFVQWLARYFGYSADERPETLYETLRLPVFRLINTLDPAAALYALDMHLASQIFSTLVRYDEERGSFVGEVAHHWKSNEEATEWTFFLRKGVLFHDGRELTGEDVRYSLMRLGSPRSAQSWLVRDIAAIDVVSRYSLRIRLRRPNYLFLFFAAYTPASIVPCGGGQRGEGVFAPIGTGPFQVAHCTPTLCVLKAFDRYYGNRAFMDRVEIVTVPEDTSINAEPDLLMLRTGESISGPNEEHGEPIRTVTGCSLLTVNLRRDGPLQDRHLREALHRLIDRRRMVEELGESRHSPASGFHLDERSQPEQAWSREAASDALRRSAYRGEPLRLYTYRRHVPDARWIERECRPYGIRIEVHEVSWAEMVQPETMAAADFILFEEVLSEGIIRLLEGYEAFFIRSHMSDGMRVSVDRKLGELLAEPKEARRESILKEIERELVQDRAVIFLVHKGVSAVSHPVLQGVRVNARGWVDFHKVWFDGKLGE